MRKKNFIMFFLAAFAAAFANPCDDGELPLEGRGTGETADKARENANREISMQINSKLRIVSRDSLSKIETDSTFEEYNKLARSTEMETNLFNAHSVKDRRLPYKDDKTGEFVSMRYICRSDAAKPYLDSLESLAVILKNSSQRISKESCKSIAETYRSIKKVEGVLIPLGQMGKAFALQKECESVYAKASRECDSAAKGVYVESSNKELKSKVSSHIAKSGCVLAENAESASIVLRMNYDECEKRDMQYKQFSCKVCVEVNLQSVKIDKSLYENIVSNKAVWTNSMKAACAEALKPVPDKIWEEIKSSISKGECK